MPSTSCCSIRVGDQYVWPASRLRRGRATRTLTEYALRRALLKTRRLFMKVALHAPGTT